MPALPGRGMVSASVAAPPEDDPKVLNALSFLAFDGQDQVPQAAASTVKVQMILETEIRCEPLYHLLHQAGEAPQEGGREGCYCSSIGDGDKMMVTIMMVVVMVMTRMIPIGVNHHVLRMCQAPSYSLSTHYPL